MNVASNFASDSSFRDRQAFKRACSQESFYSLAALAEAFPYPLC